MWPTVYIIIRKNEFKVRRSKKLQIYSFSLSFFFRGLLLITLLLLFYFCFFPSLYFITLPVHLSHFLPSHLVPFPSLISPSLTITHASFPLISFPSFPLMSSPLISFHLLSYHFISFHLIGDYTHQINSSSGSGSSSNFSHLFDWVKIAHR